FRAGPPGSLVSPNLAGRDAAAFAMCFQVFKTSEPTLAAKCLRAAEHIFDLANTAPTKLLTVIPYSFYPETEWRTTSSWARPSSTSHSRPAVSRAVLPGRI